MIKTDLLTCHQDLVRGGCYYYRGGCYYCLDDILEAQHCHRDEFHSTSGCSTSITIENVKPMR